MKVTQRSLIQSVLLYFICFPFLDDRLTYTSTQVLRHSSERSLVQGISRSPKNYIIIHLPKITLQERLTAYLQLLVWRLRLEVSNHCERSPLQAMRQPGLDPSGLPCQRRQQQGLCCSNREHLYCPLLCGCNLPNDSRLLSKGFCCLTKKTLDFELGQICTLEPRGPRNLEQTVHYDEKCPRREEKCNLYPVGFDVSRNHRAKGPGN